MRIKQILLTIGAGLIVVAGIAAATQPAYAADCNGIETSVIGGDMCAGADPNSTDPKSNIIWVLLKWVVNIMLAGVAVLAVGGIIYGAILYTSAGGNQEQVKKAYTMFTNVAIGIVAFAAMFALLNWLVPGGVGL